MKKQIFCIILAAFALTNAKAVCCKEQNNWYIQGISSFGWHNKTKVEFIDTKLHQKAGFGGALAIGRIMDCWRLELEGSHRRNHAKSKFGLMSNTALMANLYYDIPVTDVVSLYLGAGAGVASVNGKIPALHSEDGERIVKKKKGHIDTVFAWQLMGGISCALSDQWDLFGGYRLFSTAKPTLATIHHNGKHALKVKNIPICQSVEIGLRFKF